uniref:Flagellar hook-associated protein 1 n=1 Tax=Schlesneria paludicola TaxID=360056 RepID=A0A7C4LQT9_9PLAN
MALGATLTNAARSLELFSLGIQVAGQNIANAATPGYVRDALVIETSAPYRMGPLVLGMGATAVGIKQQLDSYLEHRIHTANGDASAATARQQTYMQLQSILQELGDADLSTRFNEFLAAAQAVANQPDDPTLRTLFIQQGQSLTSHVQTIRSRIEELRRTQSNQIRALAEEANGLLRSVSELNLRIVRMEANGIGGNDAGALRIQRLNALQRLSEIVPLRVVEQASGAVELFSGSDYLLIGDSYQRLEAVSAAIPTGQAAVNVRLSQTGSLLTARGGALGGLIDSREQILGGFIGELDRLVGGVIFEFNKRHASGEGLKGYGAVAGGYGVADPSLPLNAAGLFFTPQHGSFQVKVRNVATGETTVSVVSVDLDGIGVDTSLNDLQAALNAINHVAASITADGRLQLTADSGYELRFGNDTSGVLAALGINTFFAGHDSGDFRVRDEMLQDQRLLASGRGGGPADNSNLLALAEFFDQPVSALGGMSLQQFHTQMVGNLAQAGAAEEALANGFSGFLGGLKAQREQFSGVSLDEEAIRVMQFQHSYQAAARIVSTVDRLLNVLLEM